MQSPYSNPYLSMRARGLFAYYAEIGRVVSADELSAVMPEGRDAIRAAIRELRDLGYIIITKQQVNGQWRTYMKFSESARKLLSTDDGFSGALYIDNYSGTTTSTNTSTTSSKAINTDTNVSVFISGKIFPKEGNEMPWNLDGEEPKPFKRRVQPDDDVSGAIGAVPDKQAMRNAKYKSAPDVTTHRTSKPESEWTTGDLVAEFGMLLGQSSAKHLTMQLNTRSLALWINQTVGKGATRQQILKAIRIFFDDPRTLNDAGTGSPVWRRFIAFYQSVEGKVLEEETNVYVDEAFLAHQEKMLKLLEGINVRPE